MAQAREGYQALLLEMLGPPAEERVDADRLERLREALRQQGTLWAEEVTMGEVLALQREQPGPTLTLTYYPPAETPGQRGQRAFLEAFENKIHGQFPLLIVDDSRLIGEASLKPGEVRLAALRGGNMVRQELLPADRATEASEGRQKAMTALVWLLDAETAQHHRGPHPPESRQAVEAEAANTGASPEVKAITRALLWEKFFQLQRGTQAQVNELITTCKYPLMVVEYEANENPPLMQAFLRSALKEFRGKPLLLAINWTENTGTYKGQPGTVTIVYYDKGQPRHRDVISGFAAKSAHDLKNMLANYLPWREDARSVNK
jgi:hypothetical protein